MADVVDLIMQDHREVERLFAELESNPQARPTVVPVLTTLLAAHSRAEESEVYPAAADAGGADDVEHSQQEHIEADELLERLADADPEGAEFEEILAKAVESVSHHIEEEEETVLLHMRERMDVSRREELGDAFLKAREEHLGQQPADITRDELRRQADNAGITGVSGLDKASLQEELRKQADG